MTSMFGPRHYVPIVRWKNAEARALQELTEADRETLTPFVEIAQDRFDARYDPATGRRTPPARQPLLEKIVTQIGELGLVQRCFLDFGALDQCRRPFLIKGLSPWKTVFDLLAPVPSLVVPVFRLYREESPHLEAIRAYASNEGRGGCLRLQEIDLSLPDLAWRVNRLLNTLHLTPADVDLVVDMGVTYEAGVDFATVCAALPLLKKWRSFTIASGNFPPDLQEYEPRKEYSRPRVDLSRWLQEIGKQLPRIPAYGDYTIQHGVHVPRPDGPVHPSASIRYTLKDRWLILRGEDYTKQEGPGKMQWIGWAQLLCAKPEFADFGRTFSAGDAFIYDKSVNGQETGEVGDWLFAGINHHIALTSRQIANLLAA
jgi:hypothetical protein